MLPLGHLDLLPDLIFHPVSVLVKVFSHNLHRVLCEQIFSDVVLLRHSSIVVVFGVLMDFRKSPDKGSIVLSEGACGPRFD